MEHLDESGSNWLDGLGEDLARDLLDNNSPLFYSPEATPFEPETPRESLVTKLISATYSGPTIGDIESLLSMGSQNENGESSSRSSPRPIISLPEKGYGKIENKYTLRVKSSGSGLADDGYKWRKYGQKSIKNSPNPRSYYRCTNPRCNAKKQVEKSMEDPDTLIITYEGLHLHYTYPHFLLSQPHDFSASVLQLQKKPKFQTTSDQRQAPEVLQTEQTTTQSPTQVPEENPHQQLVEDFMFDGPIIGAKSPQGLLEDIVPLTVRRPCSSTTTSSNEPSYSSYSQASSPSYSSSLSWPPSSPYFDMGILSSII